MTWMTAAIGIASNAPGIPANSVPARIAMKTVSGVKPTAPRMTRGTRTAFSVSCSRTTKPMTRSAFSHPWVRAMMTAGIASQPRPQNRDDLGNPSPQTEERPELNAQHRVADGGGDADDQTEGQLPAQPVSDLLFDLVPDTADADARLRSGVEQHDPPNPRFLHQVVEGDDEDRHQTDDPAAESR